MSQPSSEQARVDRSLQERHRVSMLVERVARGNPTVADLEQAGRTLCDTGSHGITALLRLLAREKDPDLLARCAYLLQFMEEDEWLPKLIAIARGRKDLSEAGISIFNAALASYGFELPEAAAFSVDELFTGSLAEIVSSGDGTVSAFLDSFRDLSEEMQKTLIDQLSTLASAESVAVLAVIADMELNGTGEYAMRTLGRVRSPEALIALNRLEKWQINEERRLICSQSRRRLQFLGIAVNEVATSPLPESVFAGYSDSTGNRSLLITVPLPRARFKLLVVTLNELDGLREVRSIGDFSCTDGCRIKEQWLRDEGAVSIDSEYASLLLQDGIKRREVHGESLPVGFFLHRRWLTGTDNGILYEPSIAYRSATNQRVSPPSEELLDTEWFERWVVINNAVFDLAGQWLDLEGSVPAHQLAESVDGLLDQFCLTFVEEERASFLRRVLLNADLMSRVGASEALINSSLRLACDIERWAQPFHEHSFFRRLALESIELAAELLQDGYGSLIQDTNADEL
jgi:hypothetical protein